MSVRLHLNLKSLLEEGNTVVKDGGAGYDGFKLGSVKVSVSEGRAFVDIRQELLETELPVDLDLKLVNRITSYDFFLVAVALRRTGEYQYRQASATLEKMTFNKEYKYQLCISGTNLEDMKALYRDIREGRIWPTVDYEAEMVPPPCRHLRQLAREAWAIIRRDMTLRLRRV